MRKRLLNVSFPLGTDDVSTVLDRYRSTFESSLGAFLDGNIQNKLNSYHVLQCVQVS